MNKIISFTAVIFLTLILASCSTVHPSEDGPPPYDVDVSKIPNAIPKAESRSRYGNPNSYVVAGKRYRVMKTSKGYEATGIASWYGTKFHGFKTSSGESYDMLGMTAAHTSLPLPTYVAVTNLKNNKQVIVKVNDRGPFEKNRLIDLSYVAARKLGFSGTGTGLVKVVAIDPNPFHPVLASHSPALSEKHPQIYMQLGAFRSEKNAIHLQQRVKPYIHTIPSHIEKVAVNHHQPLYRVKIGPIRNVPVADSLTQRIISAGFQEPTTVVI